MENFDFNELGDDLPLRSEGPIAAVYLIGHTPTQTYYIGSSSNVLQRSRAHQSDLRKGEHPNEKLQNFHTAGDDLAYRVLHRTDDLETARNMEQSFLDANWGKPHCLNEAKDAKASAKGLTLSEETKRKIGDHSRGKTLSEEHKEKIRQAQIGIPRGSPTEETKAKVKESIYRLRTPEKRKAMAVHAAAAKSVAVKVGDVIYPSYSDAARQHGITPSTAMFRVASESDRFKDWTTIEN